MSSVSAVMIGNIIGKGDRQRIRSDARTLAVIDVLIGAALGAALFLLRRPLISPYTLTPAAETMAVNLIAIMSVVMVGMSYQMPVSFGIIQGERRHRVYHENEPDLHLVHRDAPFLYGGLLVEVAGGGGGAGDPVRPDL